MNGHVLVLNLDYRAISVCSVRRAIILVLLQKADLIEQLKDRSVRSASKSFPWPSIIRLKKYAPAPYKRVMLSRQNIIRRDRHTCQYCGSREKLTLDHVHPKSRGGKDTWENLVSACVPCNNRKGDRTPEEAGMTLSGKLYRPSHVMFIRDYVGNMDDTWKPYLFLS